MDSKVRFRKATIEDKALLEYWDTKQHVIDCDPNGSWNWEEDLANDSEFVEQYIAMLDTEPLGYLMIIDPANEPTHYWGDVEQNLRAIDIWIGEERNLGKGFGTEMMNLALEKCFTDSKVNAVLIDPLSSNKKAIRFYERLGFRYVETKFFDDDECYVMRLDREDFSILQRNNKT
ncbi:MAG: GNAT family N-acetyltransferase [Balneolaceae bacterium]|nr:GNAT family N-acetyltransferase [Balneolaceae bacterium]